MELSFLKLAEILISESPKIKIFDAIDFVNELTQKS